MTPAGALVVDDYAHHPTEVAATLAAARTLAPRRLVAVFQPHLYSRTQHLAGAFGRALAAADVVCVVDVYPARERAAGLPRGQRAERSPRRSWTRGAGREVLWLPTFDDARARARRGRLAAGDLCLVLGAGRRARARRAAGRAVGSRAMRALVIIDIQNEYAAGGQVDPAAVRSGGRRAPRRRSPPRATAGVPVAARPARDHLDRPSTGSSPAAPERRSTAPWHPRTGEAVDRQAPSERVPRDRPARTGSTRSATGRSPSRG